MSRQLSHAFCWVILPSAVLAAQGNGLTLDEAKKPQPGEVYVKKATWAETMAATRANYLQWLAEASKGDGATGFTPWDSGSVACGRPP